MWTQILHVDAAAVERMCELLSWMSYIFCGQQVSGLVYDVSLFSVSISIKVTELKEIQ